MVILRNVRVKHQMVVSFFQLKIGGRLATPVGVPLLSCLVNQGLNQAHISRSDVSYTPPTHAVVLDIKPKRLATHACG